MAQEAEKASEIIRGLIARIGAGGEAASAAG
jgi:hypothetical protein